MIETERGEIARRETLDDDVRFAGELPENSYPFRRLQIEADAALVEISHQEEEALLRIGIIPEEWRHIPARLSTGRLDLDDVGAEVTENLGTERTRDSLAEIQNANVIQYGWRHRLQTPIRSSGLAVGARGLATAKRCGRATAWPLRAFEFGIPFPYTRAANASGKALHEVPSGRDCPP